MYGGGNVQVYHTDGLGSVRAITNGSGTITETYQTDPFGVPTQTQGTSAQPFQYTGEQRDGNGLIYVRSRYYDPSTGRLLSRVAFSDPIGATQTLSRYVYAGNNPMLRVDPTGLGPTGTCEAALSADCKEFAGVGSTDRGIFPVARGYLYPLSLHLSRATIPECSIFRWEGGKSP